MTVHKRELTPAQIDDIALAIGLSADEQTKVWCLAIDPASREGVADVLVPDDACLFTGEQMYLDGYAKYPSTGTIQMTLKKRP